MVGLNTIATLVFWNRGTHKLHWMTIWRTYDHKESNTASIYESLSLKSSKSVSCHFLISVNSFTLKCWIIFYHLMPLTYLGCRFLGAVPKIRRTLAGVREHPYAGVRVSLP